MSVFRPSIIFDRRDTFERLKYHRDIVPAASKEQSRNLWCQLSEVGKGRLSRRSNRTV